MNLQGSLTFLTHRTTAEPRVGCVEETSGSRTQHVVRAVRAGELRTLAAIEEAGDALFAAHLGEDAMVAALRLPAPTGAQRDAVPGFLHVVGSPVAGFAHVIHLDGYAHLDQVSVLPERMRGGLGTALVRAAMVEAGRQGFAQLSLCTYRDVPWNGPFYAGLGFVEVLDLLPYQRRLRRAERDLGLDEAGVRVVMTVSLQPARPRPRHQRIGGGIDVTGE